MRFLNEKEKYRDAATGKDSKNYAKKQQQYIEKLKQKINQSNFKGKEPEQNHLVRRRFSKLHSSQNVNNRYSNSNLGKFNSES